MRAKNYLLSYKWQIAGWAILLVAFIAFNLIMDAGIGVINERTLKNILTVLIFTGSLSLLMIAIPMFFLYIVIFKISLWTYRWRSRHEK